MALANSSFSSHSGYYSSQYDSPQYDSPQYESSSCFSDQHCATPSCDPCMDYDPFPPLDPTMLLPVSVDYPQHGYCQQPEPYQLAFDGLLQPVQPLSTPTMHPNLVDTLKSFTLDPATSSSDMSGRTTGSTSDGSNDEARSSFRRAADRCRRRNGSMLHHSELSDMYSSSLSSSPIQSRYSRQAGDVEDDEVAVVPVDLIQNRRPFICAHQGCNKTFKNPQTMKMHNKTHYGDESAYRRNVNAPVRSTFKAGHNKKTASRCPTCKRSFVGLYELRRHYGRKHSEGEKKFGCKKVGCDKKFYIEVDLRDHEKLCGQNINCKCGMKFAFKCNMVAHKKGHPECMDEADRIKAAAKKQKVRSSSRRNVATVSSTVPGGSVLCPHNVSPPALLSHLAWSPLSSLSDNLSGITGLSGDVMSISSDSSYQPVASTIVNSFPSPGSSPGFGQATFITASQSAFC